MIWHLHARISRRIPFGWRLLHVTIDIRCFQILWRLGGWESDKVGWDLGTDPVNIFFRMPSMLLSKALVWLVIWFFLNSLLRELGSKISISSYKFSDEGVYVSEAGWGLKWTWKGHGVPQRDWIFQFITFQRANVRASIYQWCWFKVMIEVVHKPYLRHCYFHVQYYRVYFHHNYQCQ